MLHYRGWLDVEYPRIDSVEGSDTVLLHGASDEVQLVNCKLIIIEVDGGSMIDQPPENIVELSFVFCAVLLDHTNISEMIP